MDRLAECLDMEAVPVVRVLPVDSVAIPTCQPVLVLALANRAVHPVPVAVDRLVPAAAVRSGPAVVAPVVFLEGDLAADLAGAGPAVAADLSPR